MGIIKYFLLLGEFLALTEIASIAVEGSWVPSLYWAAFIAPLFVLILYNKRIATSFSYATYLIVFLLVLLRLSIVWFIKTFPLQDSFLVMLTLQSPIEGFTSFFIIEYVKVVLIISVIMSVFLTTFIRRFLVKRFRWLIVGMAVLCCVGWNLATIYLNVPIKEYKDYFFSYDEGKLRHSEFYEKNYVSMDTSQIRLKMESPKNLIFIIMESMENTFADSVRQGKNLIPELSSLRENEYNFSEDTTTFGGGYDVRGSWNTVTAIVSKTTGCPFFIAKTNPASVLVRVPSIWDVLNNYGYYNVFIQGSDGNFAGHEQFMKSHGIDAFYDMNKLKKYQDLNEKYRRFEYEEMVTFEAGITDRSLLEISKRILDTLSQNSRFSLSISTIETHFPYGFYNDQCEDKPENFSEEALFRATIRCASRDVRAFIEWVKTQPYYENTEIVIVGDHRFAGKYLVSENDTNRRWIDIFINPSLKPSEFRAFSSFDIAPSILESMGFEIQNHRMGFGVSLFSSEKTLIEQMGYLKLQEELKKFDRSFEYQLLNSPIILTPEGKEGSNVP